VIGYAITRQVKGGQGNRVEGIDALNGEVERGVGSQAHEGLLADGHHSGVAREKVPHGRHGHQDEEVHETVDHSLHDPRPPR